MTITLNKPSLKMMLAAGAAVSAIAAFSLGHYLLSPSGYLSIDVNPSIVLRTNRLDDVTSVTGVNEEAKALLEGYRLKDRDVEDVIEDLVDRMILYGYLRSDSANEVLITVDDNTVSTELVADVNNKIKSYVAERSMTANVMTQRVDVNDQLLDRADHLQVSAGKMNVIDHLAAENPALVHAQLADYRIGDLVSYAQSNNIPLELLNNQSGGTAYHDTDYGPNSDGVTDYIDTDYGPNNDGVTDFNAAVIGADGAVTYVDTDYGPYNDGVTDYIDTDYGLYNDGVTDYIDTDYGPDNDGVTDYNDTDYGPNNDGVTDYDDTDYGPNNDGVTDYDDTDYGPNNDGVTDYNDTDYGPNNDGVTDYSGGDSNYGSNYGSDYGDSGYDD